MLRNLLNLTCMHRKDKRKLAITHAQNDETVGNGSRDASSSLLNDTSISIRPVQECSSSLDTSPPFIERVINDTSLEGASRESRTTPIDFNTSEVKNDDDIAVVVRRRSVISTTPSPIPEETEEIIPDDILDSPIHRNRLRSVIGDTLYDPTSETGSIPFLKPILKPRKLAEIYNSNGASPSPSQSSNEEDETTNLVDDKILSTHSTPGVRSSHSYHEYTKKSKNNTIIGGSMRQIKNKWINVPRNSHSPRSPGRIIQLERRENDKCMFSH